MALIKARIISKTQNRRNNPRLNLVISITKARIEGDVVRLEPRISELGTSTIQSLYERSYYAGNIPVAIGSLGLRPLGLAAADFDIMHGVHQHSSTASQTTYLESRRPNNQVIKNVLVIRLKMGV